MRVAVVGAGISGMVAAHLLSQEHDVTVFEANEYAGGHTQTVQVSQGDASYWVDTGFIVFNDWTYPNFVRLLGELGVASRPTSMSFGVRCDRTGLEYGTASPGALFAQRRNALRPDFHRMLGDIVRFGRASSRLLEDDGPETTLGDYLDCGRYSPLFRSHYILPLGGAIWSTHHRRMLDFPARFFARFLNNHGMLNLVGRPTWRTIVGGSHRYVERLCRRFQNKLRLGCPVRWVERRPDGVRVAAASGEPERFDRLVLATHSDQALALLSDPSDAERDVLGAIAYQTNELALHTDVAILPRRRAAWSSWNYHVAHDDEAQAARSVAVTYDMNRLQGLDAPQPLLVTLNPSNVIDPQKVLRRLNYAHPMYTPATVAAQRRHHEINGCNRTYFCGAYWKYGFHEDGVVSALAVARHFGVPVRDTMAEHAT